MKTRFLLGGIMAVAFGAFLIVDYVGRDSLWWCDYIFLLLLALLSLGALTELCAMAQELRLRPMFRTVLVLTCFILALEVRGTGIIAGDSASALPLSLGLALVLIAVVALWRGYKDVALRDLSATVFGLFYITLPMTLLATLRNMEREGHAVLVALVVCVKGADVFAYVAGRFFGRRKIVPRLSPGKTVVGTLAGLGGATLLGWLTLTAILDVYAAPTALTFGACMGLAGFAGDIFESRVKRETGIKDSARLIPEFGGVLDIVDSILLAAPVALAFPMLLG